MDSIDFCISQNLSKALGFEKEHEIVWRVFLSMDIMGFRYNGLKTGVYEIFNGLNSICSDFIERCCHFFNFTRQSYCLNELPPNKYCNGLVVEVDDFYLDYHPYFKKHHHNRYVVITEISECTYKIYDMAEFQISHSSFNQAVTNAFFICANDELLLDNNNFDRDLGIYYEKKNWEHNSECVKNVIIFRDDLKSKINSLNEADFESLYFFTNKLGGPSQSRKFMNIALTELFKNIDKTSEKLFLINDFMSELAYEWDILGNMFFKMSKYPNKKMIDRILKWLDKIIDLESKLESL